MNTGVSQPQAAAGPCQQTSTPPAASALRDCAAPKKACDDRTASFPQRHGNLLSRLLLFSPTTPKRRAFGDRTGKARSKDVMWTTLPNELVGNIFSRLPESSKKAGRLVCLDWCAGVSASISKLGLSCGFSPPRMDPFSRPVRDAFPNVTDADLGYLGSVRVDSLREQLRKMPQLTTLHGTISFAVQGDTPKQILAAIREEQPRVTRLGLKMTSTCDEEDALDMMQAAAPQLTALDLSDCTVQWAEAIDSLQSLKSIESLGLKLDAASGEACMGVIAGMAGLTRLRVSARFQVTSPMLTALSRLTELREFELDADGNPEADVTLGAVLARLPKLQSLSFSAGRLPSAAQWSDAGMAVLATNLPSLVELKLGSQVITDAGTVNPHVVGKLVIRSK
ncbi:hypothetical protein WJX72_005463 [[Myrmecia] bisecta]|uniref:F-box domain-containing protein n=1 Tax=[Myrmecia] bisecta TaxID=41462 RepID=A0AAW1P834_9CHLO